MISGCSKNTMDSQACIRPDSLTGMIFAMEGIKNTMVLLNGPMGCKFYHSTTSQFLSLRPMLYLPLTECGGNKKVPVDYNYLNDWFFRQPRVPSTTLDGYDYVYGTSEKVQEALEYIHAHVDFDLLAIINSPGACLIGDNLKELASRILPGKNCVMLESPGFSLEYQEGYSEAGLELLKQFKDKLHDPETNKIKKRVNILGLSIWDRYLEGDRAELIRLLNLCGIEVNCCLCAENSFEAFLDIRQAELNLVLDSERGLAAARYLKDNFGMDYYVCESLPVGFSATEKMAADICAYFNTDIQAFRTVSEKARAICYSKISDIYQMCGLPKGATFYVEGSAVQKKAFTAFFTDYMAMTATTMEKAELVFGDANTIAQLNLLERGNHVFCGIEINNPGMGYTDVCPKTQMGIMGAMFLTEQVLNGLMSKI